MAKKTGRTHYQTARKGLYYELIDFHNKAKIQGFNIACQDSNVYKGITKDLIKTKKVEEIVAKPKKDVSEVVESEVEVVEVVETPKVNKNVAHDLIYDREQKKWLHVTVEYDIATVKSEPIGLNQAVALKKIQDLFMHKAIKGGK